MRDVAAVTDDNTIDQSRDDRRAADLLLTSDLTLCDPGAGPPGGSEERRGGAAGGAGAARDGAVWEVGEGRPGDCRIRVLVPEVPDPSMTLSRWHGAGTGPLGHGAGRVGRGVLPLPSHTAMTISPPGLTRI